VIVQVFGRPERCDALTNPHWRPEIVEELLPQAGLAVERALDISWTYGDTTTPGGTNEWHIVVARVDSGRPRSS
jgi:hypothetical protein